MATGTAMTKDQYVKRVMSNAAEFNKTFPKPIPNSRPSEATMVRPLNTPKSRGSAMVQPARETTDELRRQILQNRLDQARIEQAQMIRGAQEIPPMPSRTIPNQAPMRTSLPPIGVAVPATRYRQLEAATKLPAKAMPVAPATGWDKVKNVAKGVVAGATLGMAPAVGNLVNNLMTKKKAAVTGAKAIAPSGQRAAWNNLSVSSGPVRGGSNYNPQK